MSKLNFRLRSPVGQWIRAGDASRDRMRWHEAADHYERVLESKPDLAAIWVQLGHVRKEVGNLAAAREAYLNALERQPGASDTALQIGHLCKVSGDILGAETWYERSLQMDDDNLHARRELAAIRGRDSLASVVDVHEIAFRTSPIKTFFWDCTAVRNWCNSGGEFSAEAMWFAQLGRSLARAMNVVPVAFDQDNACFVRYSFDWAQLGSEPGVRVTPSNKDHCALIVDCYAAVQTPTFIRLLSSARNDLNLTVTGVLRSPLTGGGTDVRYAGTDYQFDNLMAVARNAAKLITRQGMAREWAEDVATRVGRPLASVLTVSSPGLSGPRSLPTKGDLKRSTILVLAPSTAAEWHAIGLQTSLICDLSTDIAVVSVGAIKDWLNAPIPGNDCRSLGVVDLEAAWFQTEAHTVRAILIPASRFDGSIWATHAKRHGAEVFSHASNKDVVEELGGHANFFANDRPFDVPSVTWAPVQRDQNDCHNDDPYEPWRVALSVIEENVLDGTPPPEPVNQLQYGIFYGLESPHGHQRLYSEADGLWMLTGAGWGQTTRHYTCLTSAAASVEFTPSIRSDVEVSSRILIYVLAADENETLISNFFWHQCEGVIREIDGNSRRRETYAVTVDTAAFESCRAGSRYAVGGFVAYPSDQDYLWHEFLDRTSRAIYSFKNGLGRRVDSDAS
jgi:hypothetical protein